MLVVTRPPLRCLGLHSVALQDSNTPAWVLMSTCAPTLLAHQVEGIFNTLLEDEDLLGLLFSLLEVGGGVSVCTGRAWRPTLDGNLACGAGVRQGAVLPSPANA